ncbi:MAG: T9SS type A sorting domain-containing protein [Bacteroidetes bacterium]|nr:T9SS type A sorting domain-containing protein [Bacteroidota bacterium]
MKSKLYLIIVLLFASFISYAQNPVPNPGFETWNNGNATDWVSNNVPGLYTPVTQSTSAHLGGSSVKGDVVNYSGTNIPPLLYSAPVGSQSGFPITTSYNVLRFYYKFVSSVANDVLTTFVSFQDINNNTVAYGAGNLSVVSNAWTLGEIPLNYTGTNPTNAVISFSISNNTGNIPAIGTYFLIDDVSLDISSGLSEANNLSIGNLYPNPTEQQINLPFHLNQSGQTKLQIVDLQGRVIYTLLDQYLPAGDYRIQEDFEILESGCYLFQLQFENNIVSKLFQIHQN